MDTKKLDRETLEKMITAFERDRALVSINLKNGETYNRNRALTELMQLVASLIEKRSKETANLGTILHKYVEQDLHHAECRMLDKEYDELNGLNYSGDY